MGVSVILTHKYRFVKDKGTMCPMCTKYEEDDIHFLLQCPFYHDMCVKYIKPFHSPINEVSFNSILKIEHLSVITFLSLYAYVTRCL